MKVTFVIGQLIGGGAERVVCNLANSMVNDNIDVQILTLKKGKNYPLDSRVIVRNIDNKINNSIVKKIKKEIDLGKIIKVNETDVYVVFMAVEICAFMHHRKYAKAPIIVSERNDPSRYPRHLKMLLKYYVPKADGAVFQTKEAEKWYGLDSGVATTIIPNPINQVFLTDNDNAYNPDGDIVGIGRLTAQKNWSLLIRAYSNLPDEIRIKHKLSIYGEGEDKTKLQCLCNELGIYDKVIFHGFTDSVKEVLLNASLFVLPSNYEGMPNSLMEAMALGVPCIATDCPIGGPATLIVNGKNGWLVPVGSDEEMSKTMRCILSNNEEAMKVGKEAKITAEKYKPGYVGELWRKFIKSIVDNGIDLKQ